MGFLSNLLGRAKTAEAEIAERRQREPTEQERARADYSAILQSEVEGTVAPDVALADIMGKLGLTAAAVEADLTRLRELHAKQTPPKELARLEREASDAQQQWDDERRRREEYDSLPGRLLSAARAAAQKRDDAQLTRAMYAGALAAVGKPALPRPDPNVVKIDGMTTIRRPAPEPESEPAAKPQQPIVLGRSPAPIRVVGLPDGTVGVTAG